MLANHLIEMSSNNFTDLPDLVDLLDLEVSNKFQTIITFFLKAIFFLLKEDIHHW